jgi:hypothetical protein
MTLLKEITDKGAVLEWSPIADTARVVALGTKVRLLIYIVVAIQRH